MFDPADDTPAYDAHEAAALAAVDSDMQDALDHAQHLFAEAHFGTSSVPSMAAPCAPGSAV